MFTVISVTLFTIYSGYGCRRLNQSVAISQSKRAARSDGSSPWVLHRLPFPHERYSNRSCYRKVERSDPCADWKRGKNGKRIPKISTQYQTKLIYIDVTIAGALLLYVLGAPGICILSCFSGWHFKIYNFLILIFISLKGYCYRRRRTLYTDTW